ncbi:MAG: leucine-rich repeat protein [Paludibacteraceae bacterium]
MSKRKLLSLLGLMTIVCSLTAQTQDAASGLWYTSTVAGHATIVAPPDGEAAYTGAVRIPSTIVSSEGTYTVDTIGPNAFKSSTITVVEIPATVNFIGVYAFSSCTALSTIRCHATTPPTLGTASKLNFGTVTFVYPFDDNLFSTLSPQVPDTAAYAAATVWKMFTNGFEYILYDITIAGIEVTAENKDNITGEGITGTVRYDNEANVLLLSDATITTTSTTHGIEFYRPDLTIRLEGKNTILPDQYSCIYVGAAGTITGPGSLENSGDIVTDADLTFKNTTVTAERLYVEDPSTNATFAFNKAYVTLSGDRNNETIVCSELNLTDCEFLYPASASFNATAKTVVDADGYGIIDDIVIGRAYGLVVGDVEVTDRNKDKITGEAITGTISYDSETSTLTLDNASIAATATFGIKQLTELDSLHINVVGNDTVRGKDTPILLYTNTAMSISGDGHLYVELPESELLHDFSIAIQLESGAAMAIRNTSLEVVSAKHGICNMDMTLAKLAIDHSTVSIKCSTGTTAIGGMESLDLSGCQILSPAGAYYNNWDMYVLYNEDGTLCSEVFIGRTYGITVAGVSVHELNKDNVIGEGITGTVRYDIDTHTLTLDNAKITSATSACINISRDMNVLIELIGEDSLTTGGTYALYIGQNDTITIAGDGSLAIESSQNGIGLSSASQLTISECQVAVNGATRGITGIDGTKGETLILDKATVRAKGTANGSICNLQTLDFTDCSIVSPESAIWKSANHQIESKDGSVVTDEVVIARIYPVYVAGVQLNAINKDDIATAAGISTGTITFDDENNVLTLENVVLETTKNGIETIGSTGLTIELVGDNSIKSDKNGIFAYTALTIDGNGSGKLAITAGNTALNSFSESLVISKAEVTASGAQYGIYGSSNSELEISKSTVRAKGTANGSIARFKSITLTNCNIVSPSGAEIGKDNEESLYYSVLQDGVVVTDTIVIEAQTTAIETIEAAQPLFYAHDGRIYGAEGMRIYTLLGLDVTHMNGQLNGVYIVKTADTAQKIVVR